MQLQIMMLMHTDVGLNVHFYALKLFTTTENESQSLPSESVGKGKKMGKFVYVRWTSERGLIQASDWLKIWVRKELLRLNTPGKLKCLGSNNDQPWVAIGMTTRLRAGQPKNCVSILGRGHSFLSSPPILDQHWRQSSLLFSGSGAFLPGVLRSVREADQSPHLVPWKRIIGAATPLPLYTFICQARGKLTIGSSG